MKYSKNLSKNTKNGNQALTNVPLQRKNLNPKTKKNYFSAESLVGALGKGDCAEGGPSAQALALPTAPAGSRQRPVNRRKPWSTPLPRAGSRRSAQVSSVPTARRRSRRHSGRQPKCDGARSFSDGALRAEGWLSAKIFCAEGPRKSPRQRQKP
jgi:hypothetical protein